MFLLLLQNPLILSMGWLVGIQNKERWLLQENNRVLCKGPGARMLSILITLSAKGGFKGMVFIGAQTAS